MKPVANISLPKGGKSSIEVDDAAVDAVQHRIDTDPAVHSAFVALFRSHIRRQRAEAAQSEAASA